MNVQIVKRVCGKQTICRMGTVKMSSSRSLTALTVNEHKKWTNYQYHYFHSDEVLTHYIYMTVYLEVISRTHARPNTYTHTQIQTHTYTNA